MARLRLHIDEARGQKKEADNAAPRSLPRAAPKRARAPRFAPAGQSTQLIVARTTTLALSGKAISVMKNRGPRALDGHAGFITVHPSSLLRAPNAAAREAGFEAFVADLKTVKKLAASYSKAA